MSSMEAGGSGKNSKSKGKENVDYNSSQFTGKVEEKLYNRVWIRNRAVIERDIDLVTLENSSIEFLQNFMSRGWISLTMFKAESIITFYKEFMTNINYKPVTKRGKERASLLWAIAMRKTIDLPRMMFMSLCATHTASDMRGSMPFTGFLMELFKRSGVHHPINLIRIEPGRLIDRSSLSRSEGQRKKRRLEAIAPEKPSIGMLN
ncbi:TRNA-dihydrouridine(47) synthase [Actinidia chinensis var. chinensis]|uniref:tRNA-dihydrouridine(47) synthase n=1 Tax=Actinidia chinensis var. chinensis TaxID=1590841 RepID=A0A2R6QHD9_ACTCC|nr:TRNA-dihydrouridine(47) synthase [Actinidia chinensis var. chinensis]